MRCTGNGLSRRSFLAVGSLGGLGLTLADYMFLRSARGDLKTYDYLEPKADSVIHIYLPGGMAHQESFDPKPYSPLEYRGDFGVCKTNTGEEFCETVPNLAKIADKFCVIRSMTHSEAAHERGTHNMFTGYRPSPALIFPSMGSVVSHEYGPRKNLPPYVCIPNMPNIYAGTGYLSSSYAPFDLGADPASNGFKVRDLDLPGIDDARFARRREALDVINSNFLGQTSSDKVGAMNTFYERAYGVIASKEAKDAFNIDAEDAKLRDEYGRNTAGQRLLMARRLVAAGVRFVTLTYGGWDHHAGISGAMKGQMPALDQALAALINDLDRSGLLARTVVMVSSEFGRTPKINKDAGRDHWSKVFSVLLAGGGIKGGMIYGASAATAGEPDSAPVEPQDLATTVYNQLGIVADKELMAPGDRPIEIVDGGKVLSKIIA